MYKYIGLLKRSLISLCAVFSLCRLPPPSLCLKQYAESAECGFWLFHTHLKNSTTCEPGGDQCLVTWNVFGSKVSSSSSCWSSHSQTACYSPHIAVSTLSCLLMQLLLRLQVKNISSKRSGVFTLTEVIPAICFIGSSENNCISTTEGVTNSSSEVVDEQGLRGFAAKGHFLCEKYL